MTPNTPRIVEHICSANYDISTKVTKLYAVAMINYRQPVGDLAWDKIRGLIGKDATDAIAYCTGAAAAGGGQRGFENLLQSEIETP